MMIKRILAGIGANSLGMAVNIGMQLASLPLYLHFWTAEKYGIWLMLTAVPSYLSMADVGMVTATANKMTMAIGRNDHAAANRIFQTTQQFMSLMCGIISVTLIPCILFIPVTRFIDTSERVALAALCVGVLFALFGGLSDAVFKATERYALGTLIGDSVRFCEWLGFICGLVLFGSFVGVAVSGLFMRVAGTFVAMFLTRARRHGLSWGIEQSDHTELRLTLRSAVLFRAFPISNAISLQGVTLLVGITLGPATVAIFNTYRTISRIAVQVSAIMSHALWPEFSRLYGMGANSKIEQVYRRANLVGFAQAVMLSVVIYLLSPIMLHFWTHDKIAFNADLMAVILLYAAVGGAWHVSRILLLATNTHVRLAFWSIVSSILTVGLVFVVVNGFDLVGVGLAMVVGELFVAIISLRLAYAVVWPKL